MVAGSVHRGDGVTGHAPLVQVRGLTKNFARRSAIFSRLTGEDAVVRAVAGIDLEIGRGETLGLVGESGSGKSTTGYILAKLETMSSGEYRYRDVDVSDLNRRDLKAFRRRVQIVFQDPSDALNPRHTVSRIVTEPLLIHQIGDRKERQERMAKALEMVELKPWNVYANRFPVELSGGQRQRVAIARAIILDPEFVIADEPVSMLDVSVRLGLMNLLLDLQQRLGMSYLFITHDLSVARYLCHRIAVMHKGRVVESGVADRVLDSPQEEYTRLLRRSVTSPSDVAARLLDTSSDPGTWRSGEWRTP